VDFVKTAFEAVEPERLEDDAGVLQVARLGIGEVERNLGMADLDAALGAAC
jgi:hypothetical protein